MTDAVAATPEPHATRTEQARAAVATEQAEVMKLEKSHAKPDEQARARRRRSDLVQAWRREADAWVAAAPSDPAARAAVAAAKKAQAEFYMPSGGLVDP